MCDTCGCNLTAAHQHPNESQDQSSHDHAHQVTVLKGLLDENDHQAAHNRHHLRQHHVLALNLMSSPGSGKTSLLEATIDALGSKYRIGVIEGDLETENDTERLRKKGIPAVQITTGTACHLDAQMIHRALHELDLANLDLLFIENVGNLVCPASFDLGQDHNIVLLSVTEGDDKPAKYPVMFRIADLVLISKADLLPYLDDFQPQRALTGIRALATDVPIVTLSARSSLGLDDWISWLETELQAARLVAEAV